MKVQKVLIVSLLSLSSLILIFAIPSQIEASTPPNSKHLSIAAANKDDTLKSGGFKTIEEKTSGDVEIVRANNGRLFIVFDDNFRTQEGPDLFVVLSRSPDLQNSSSERRDFFMISPLLRIKGEQTYILPGDFEPSEFNSIAIWSRQKNVVFGAAPLTAK